MPLGANIQLANTFNDWRIRTNEIIEMLSGGGGGLVFVDGTTTGNVTLTNTMTANTFKAANGSASSPAYAWTSDANSGFYKIANSRLGLSLAQTLILDISAARTVFQQNAYIGFANTTGSDTAGIVREADGTLALRTPAANTTAHQLRVYNVWNSATDFERTVMGWASNTYIIAVANAGTGVARSLRLSVPTGGGHTLRVNATDIALINSTGLYVTGLANVSGILGAGNTTITGTLTSGNASVGTLASGNTVVSGTLGAGNTSITGTLATGNTTVTGFVSISTTLAAGNTTITGNAAVSHTLSTANATASHTLSAANAAVSGTLSLSTNFTVNTTILTLTTAPLTVNSTILNANVVVRCDTTNGRLVIPVGANLWAT